MNEQVFSFDEKTLEFIHIFSGRRLRKSRFELLQFSPYPNGRLLASPSRSRAC